MFQPQHPGFAAPPRPVTAGSAGRTAAAFFIGGALTTAFSLLFTIVVSEVLWNELAGPLSHAREAEINVVDLAGSALVGGLMAVCFLVAKAKGPVVPFVAAAGAFLADRVASLLYGTLYAPIRLHFSVTTGLKFSIKEYGHYSLTDWGIAFSVPIVAGGLTAIWALRRTPAVPQASMPWPQPGPAYNPAGPPPPGMGGQTPPGAMPPGQTPPGVMPPGPMNQQAPYPPRPS